MSHFVLDGDVMHDVFVLLWMVMLMRVCLLSCNLLLLLLVVYKAVRRL